MHTLGLAAVCLPQNMNLAASSMGAPQHHRSVAWWIGVGPLHASVNETQVCHVPGELGERTVKPHFILLPAGTMGRAVGKATKKFQKNHLAGAIKKRKQGQKIGKWKAARAAPPKSLLRAAADAEAAPVVDAEEAKGLGDMDVDEFLAMGLAGEEEDEGSDEDEDEVRRRRRTRDWLSFRPSRCA